MLIWDGCDIDSDKCVWKEDKMGFLHAPYNPTILQRPDLGPFNYCPNCGSRIVIEEYEDE
jgi:hypothetical protein